MVWPDVIQSKPAGTALRATAQCGLLVHRLPACTWDFGGGSADDDREVHQAAVSGSCSTRSASPSAMPARYLKAWADVTPDPGAAGERSAWSPPARRRTGTCFASASSGWASRCSTRTTPSSRSGCGSTATPRVSDAEKIQCRVAADRPGGRRRRVLRLARRAGGRRVRGRAHPRHAALVRARGARLARAPPRRLCARRGTRPGGREAAARVAAAHGWCRPIRASPRHRPTP